MGRGAALLRRLCLRAPGLALRLALPLLLLGGVLLLSAGLYSYQRLTDEALLAELEFRPLGEQRYVATLRDHEGCRTREYLLLGDQWRIDAWFVKWHYWAALLGLDPLYRLDRLEGRYRQNDQQNSRPHRAHDLREAATLDLLDGLQRLGRGNPLFDASYGSSAYAPIDPAMRYRLYRGQSGLLIRTLPRPPPAEQQGGLTIRINHACGAAQSRWQRLAEALERGFAGVMSGLGRPGTHGADP